MENSRRRFEAVQSSCTHTHARARTQTLTGEPDGSQRVLAARRAGYSASRQVDCVYR